ncbi:hypothetical protein KIPB_010970 [Kipferlia bialata]|uniref:PH domain-containing protein n=1 Tax=Kipferlia bialata TaxID=797122 RepID=A0A391NPX9_9EUKA|nr:hypothetical protein KIPB_010970 [Kipferlia bialata]|eukprot:g10970.t1
MLTPQARTANNGLLLEEVVSCTVIRDRRVVVSTAERPYVFEMKSAEEADKWHRAIETARQALAAQAEGADIPIGTPVDALPGGQGEDSATTVVATQR